MKSLRITESFSTIFLLSIVMFPFAGAQDLEEVLPKKVEVSVIDYSDDFEPSITVPPAMDSTIIDDFEAANAALFNQQEDKQQEVASKEIQLGMILRNAYYRKITTPRWAKILSAESWRASFLKWRYYAQIEDYVRSSSEVVSKIKKEPSIGIIKKASPKVEAPSKRLKDSILIALKEDLNAEKETPIVQKLLSINQKEITEEEIFDMDSTIVKEFVFDFSILDLSLPDTVVSEKELYTEAISVLPEFVGEPNQSDPSNETFREEEQIVFAIPNKVKTDLVVDSREVEAETTTIEKIIPATEPNIEESVKKTASKPALPLITDRQSMTEGFASSYSKLPWPVKGGIITDKYGYRKNAAARGLKRENYGIDISAPSSSRVNAVFAGTVLMVIKQAPYDYIITLKHGDFTTAYYFLDKVNVQVGEQVQVGQGLGTLRQEKGTAPFHFEIWQDQERVNPEPWLKA